MSEIEQTIEPSLTERVSCVLKDEYGSNMVVSGVITLGIIGIVMGIMVMVYANVEPNIVGTSDTSNATITKVNTNVYKGFDLGSISPLVVAAGLVVSIVLSMAALIAYRGREE